MFRSIESSSSAPILSLVRWCLDSEPADPGHLCPRWLWLRALGLIFFSAFYSLAFQIRGLVGPRGILPAGDYLSAVAEHLGALRFWYAPTLLWIGSGPHALMLICWAGLAASLLLVLNLWPRAAIAVCVACFMSFVASAQDFSSYQSDGMLLAAGFLSLFFAPRGLRPRLGARSRPSRVSLFMLQWLWFTIYFESGMVKLASGDPQWRHLTAMYEYYQNGPLPNWVGWYAQQLPHGIQAAIALATLMIELGAPWALFLPRRFRLVCFLVVTPFQIGIILTANLTFLNYFVLALGFLLLDDRALRWLSGRLPFTSRERERRLETGKSGFEAGPPVPQDAGSDLPQSEASTPLIAAGGLLALRQALARADRHLRRFFTGLMLSWIFYDTATLLLLMLVPRLPLPTLPILALEPFRIANQYGLFAVMTTARYEIEFQGSRDGVHWTAYPFRYKPQNPAEAPCWYAPFQPRFDWNLWFASLGTWREYPWVVRTEVLLLKNDPVVLSLFAGNPFSGDPPRAVRAVEWQYWFTDRSTLRRTGLWWRRELRGSYAPAVELGPGGEAIIEQPATP